MKNSLFQRDTVQRRVILEELQKLTSHPTAGELYRIVLQRLPKVSLGTVYRNLERLNRSGLIQKIEFSGAESRFDGNVRQHDHLRCVQCGRVDDVSAPPLDLLGGGANDFNGYAILGHRLEFLGICPACLKGQEDAGDCAVAIPISSSKTVLNQGAALHVPKPR